MGGACTKPSADEDIEYYGPADRPRNVPLDLKHWKMLLAEQAKRQQPQHSGGPMSAETTSPSSSGEELITPGGTHIERMKETMSEEVRKLPSNSGALAVI